MESNIAFAPWPTSGNIRLMQAPIVARQHFVPHSSITCKGSGCVACAAASKIKRRAFFRRLFRRDSWSRVAGGKLYMMSVLDKSTNKMHVVTMNEWAYRRHLRQTLPWRQRPLAFVADTFRWLSGRMG